MATTKHSEINNIVEQYHNIFNSVKLTDSQWNMVDYQESWKIPKKKSILSLRDAINKLETTFSENCNCLTNTDCCQSCQLCQTASNTLACESCQTQTCQTTICQTQSCQESMCQTVVCQSCQSSHCQSCETCESCQTCQTYTMGEEHILTLTNDHYKMSDLFPDIYTTMTTVPYRLDTSKLTTSVDMFKDCEYLQEIPDLDLDEVIDAAHMFDNCKSLSKIPYMKLAKLNVADFMFYNTPIEEVPLFIQDYPYIISWDYMFAKCSKLKKAIINTTSMQTMDSTFMECSSLTEVSPINLSNIKRNDAISTAFIHSGLKEIHFDHVTAAKLSLIYNNLADITSYAPNPKTYIDNIILFNDNYHKLYELYSKEYCLKLSQLSYNINLNGLTRLDEMFKYCSVLTTDNINDTIEQFSNTKISTTESLFEDCYALTSIPDFCITLFNNDSVTTTKAMFKNCTALTNDSMLNFNTPSVIYFNEMFMNCKYITSIVIDFSSALEVTNMFKGCTNLQKVIIINASQKIQNDIKNNNVLGQNIGTSVYFI